MVHINMPMALKWVPHPTAIWEFLNEGGIKKKALVWLGIGSLNLARMEKGFN